MENEWQTLQSQNDKLQQELDEVRKQKKLSLESQMYYSTESGRMKAERERESESSSSSILTMIDGWIVVLSVVLYVCLTYSFVAESAEQQLKTAHNKEGKQKPIHPNP